MQKRVYGHHKQGARFGHTKIQGKSLLVRGLNALAAVVSTPLAAPVIAATRLRGGNAASARGAASLAARRSAPRGPAAAPGRSSSGWTRRYYNAAVIGAIRRGGARFSVTVPDEHQHPRRDRRHRRGRLDADPVPARDLGRPAGAPGSPTPRSPRVEYTAFASKKGQAVTARLVVRRVRDLNKQGRRRAGRAVPRLALPRGVHRLAVRAGYLKP